MVAEHSDLLTGWPPNQYAVRHAELKRERSGSIGRFSPSTAPDFAPPCPATCVFLQEDAPGAGLLHLKGLTGLQTLLLQGTKVTVAGVADLQKVLPNCKTIK